MTFMIGIKAVTITEQYKGRLMTFETLGSPSRDHTRAEAQAAEIGRLFRQSKTLTDNNPDSVIELVGYVASQIKNMYTDRKITDTARVAHYGTSGKALGAASLAVKSDLHYRTDVGNFSTVEITTVSGRMEGESEKLAAGLLCLAAMDAERYGQGLLIDINRESPDIA